jgi:hypothetical protein
MAAVTPSCVLAPASVLLLSWLFLLLNEEMRMQLAPCMLTKQGWQNRCQFMAAACPPNKRLLSVCTDHYMA